MSGSLGMGGTKGNQPGGGWIFPKSGSLTWCLSPSLLPPFPFQDPKQTRPSWACGYYSPRWVNSPRLPPTWLPEHSLGTPETAPSSLVIPWSPAQSIPAGGVHTLSFFQTPLGTKCKGALSILWKEHQLLPTASRKEWVRAGDSFVLETKTEKKTQARTAAAAKTELASRPPSSVTSLSSRPPRGWGVVICCFPWVGLGFGGHKTIQREVPQYPRGHSNPICPRS